jgi:threonine synthase
VSRGGPWFGGYRCSACGSQFGPEGTEGAEAAGAARYRCPRDGGCLDVVLEFSRLRRDLDPRRFLRSEASHWRYLPLLPVGDPGGRGTPLRQVGATPVYSLPALRKSRGLPRLWLKDEGRNPTASLKDRASSVVVARARELGAEVVVTASTGNAGAALAGMAAAIGQAAVVLAPRSAPPAKVAQMLVFGARVILVEGSYDQASALALEASAELGWYCRNTGFNPFTAEGKKTAAFEIWEEFLAGRRRPPVPKGERLSIFVPVGDGNIIAGLHKGFRDLEELGWLEAMPRLFGVQAEGSAAIARAWQAGSEEITPVRASTVADSISVDLPADGLRALRAASRTGGAYLTVSDRRILEAIVELGGAGVFAEPAAAAAYAGLLGALEQGLVAPGDCLLVLCTGNGLKDVGAARRALGIAGEEQPGRSVEPASPTAPGAPVIEPTLAALKTVLGR